MLISALMCVFLFSPGILCAEYTVTEILFIPWGEGEEQLKIALPHGLDVHGTPFNYCDDTYEILGGGPSYGFVDQVDNIYFSSYEHNYLKVFDPTGRLILDFSQGHPVYDSIIGHYSMGYFYVDTLCQIYVLSSQSLDHIPVIDTLGNLINKLNPVGIGSGVEILRIFPNSLDNLTVLCRNENYYFYTNNSFLPGGSNGWRAVDGFYYSAARNDSSNIGFTAFSDSDIEGNKSDLSHFIVPFGSNILHARLLGVDDNMNLYVFITESVTDTKVRVYNADYQLQDEIILAPRSNKYHWHIWPFMRTDGTLYEFRCLDDGLHVVRWSKK